VPVTIISQSVPAIFELISVDTHAKFLLTGILLFRMLLQWACLEIILGVVYNPLLVSGLIFRPSRTNKKIILRQLNLCRPGTDCLTLWASCSYSEILPFPYGFSGCFGWLRSHLNLVINKALFILILNMARNNHVMKIITSLTFPTAKESLSPSIVNLVGMRFTFYEINLLKRISIKHPTHLA